MVWAALLSTNAICMTGDGSPVSFGDSIVAHSATGAHWTKFMTTVAKVAILTKSRIFLPQAIDRAELPDKVPADIVSEFRESELDAAHGAYRSGSAMLRSVLAKTLKKNGYDEVEIPVAGAMKKTRQLFHRIEAAANDAVITQARKTRAQENIGVLGNDILHDDWREVKQDEYEEAHHYAQRILEDLYDDRTTVETISQGQGPPVHASA
jgi:hypothetical protein